MPHERDHVVPAEHVAWRTLCGFARLEDARLMYRLQRAVVLQGDLGSVFEFFKNPRNLELLTPPWLGFRIVAVNNAVVCKGTRIRYRLRLCGIPFSWESEIIEYEEREAFADEQISGPYARWLHHHRFRRVDGGVEMTDNVEYALPFGYLGRLVHWLVVRHQLQSIFDYRNRVIAQRFGGKVHSLPPL